MKITEITPVKTTFSVRKVREAIALCQKQFGVNYLYYGNCGLFAIALSTWIAQKFTVNSGLVGVVISFADDPNGALSMAEVRGRDMNHVFSHVEIGSRWYLFDGDGLVSEKALEGWHAQTWRDYAYDPEKWETEHGDSPRPNGVRLCFGGLDPVSIAAVEEGTDYWADWQEFYRFLSTGT
jgi:hypothetical protein